jgi:bacterioferritin-associated ferredoxin
MEVIEYHFQYPTMIVCLCKGVPESAIQGHIEEGIGSVDAIGRACGAGTDCGACRGAIEELIHEACVTRHARQIAALRAPCGPSLDSERDSGHEGQRSSH